MPVANRDVDPKRAAEVLGTKKRGRRDRNDKSGKQNKGQRRLN